MSDPAAGLRELSEPWARGDRIKAAIDRAAKRAGLSYWRTFDLWYGKARRVEPYELTAISEALDKKRKEANRNELHELRTRLARLESRLAQTDAEFHRETIAQVRSQVGRSGGMGRTLASRLKPT